LTDIEGEGSGEPPADFVEFFTETYDGLRRMASFMLAGDLGRADELVENVLLTMLKSWGGIQDPQAHAARVTAFRIAQESAPRQRRSALLRRDRSVEPVAVAVGGGVPDDLPQPLVPESFSRLTGEQRVIVVLWWLYGWDARDIAKALALRPRRVDKEIRHLQSQLRSVFGQAGMRAGMFDGNDITGELL
jgi:DNA-directed RNA polymerase specialized sigma24 family protein